MQLQQTLIVEKLNHLTAILDDASEGFLTASIHSRSKDLESFFEKLSYQRKDFSRDIKKLVQSMGAHSYSKGGFLSLLHRTWKDMSYQLKSRDKDAVKTCCVIGEKFTSNYYESILADPEMPEPVKDVLVQQFKSIQQTLHEFEMSQSNAAMTAIAQGTATATDHPEAVSAAAAKKMLFLISYLQHISRDFEMIADEIQDKNLRNAFISLSEENSQFADELNCQAKQYGLSKPDSDLALYWFKAEEENFEATPTSRDNELMQICDKSEYLFLKLYTDALKEFLSFRTLKDVMIYQYNSIRAGFFKLRLLNSLRYNNEYSHL